MIFNASLAAILSFATLVAAQGSSTHSSGSASVSGSGSANAPAPSISSCILGCVTPAATAAGCSGFTDLACVCTSQKFQQAAMDCLRANCTSSDVTTALGLQSSECAAAGGSALSSAAGSTHSGSASTTAPGTGATAAPTSAAAGSNAPASTSHAAAPTTSTGAASSTAASVWGIVAGIMGAAAAAAL